MMSFRTGLSGLVSALATSLIVLGALSLSLTEGMVFSVPTSQPEPTFPPVNLTPLANLTPTPAITTQAPATPVLVTQTKDLSTTCQQPAGWETYTIQPGDTLEALAAERNIPVEQIMIGNCLVSPQVMHGTFLYLPVSTPSPTMTVTKTATVTPTSTVRSTTAPGVVYPSPVPCGPLPGWVRYFVQPGDTLFTLSRELNTSVSQIQHANCLGSSTLIRAGSWLWVPRLPYRTPTATQPTPKPTGTNSPIPTSTSTLTPTATLTATATATGTATSTPTATLTEIPTETPTETNTP